MGVVFPLYFKVEWCENVWMNIYNSQKKWYRFFFKVSIHRVYIIFFLQDPIHLIWILLTICYNYDIITFLKIIFTHFISEFLKVIFRIWIVAKTFLCIRQYNGNGLLRSSIRGPFWTEMIGLYESRNLLINERGHCKLKFSVLKLLLSFYARQRERKI